MSDTVWKMSTTEQHYYCVSHAMNMHNVLSEHILGGRNSPKLRIYPQGPESRLTYLLTTQRPKIKPATHKVTMIIQLNSILL